jgi:hypothetical protein
LLDIVRAHYARYFGDDLTRINVERFTDGRAACCLRAMVTSQDLPRGRVLWAVAI